ncbi:MAG: (2Fe-2S)-binding protein [Candidatus Hodarchaeales archaeon]|jgi:bacterioferritin-associated ferredoxin
MGKTFICRCEDVEEKEKEVVDAVKLGFDDLETIKRFTGIGTGPCQGKGCIAETIELLAKIRGVKPETIPLTTQRQPLTPVTFAALAGEPANED